MQVHDDKLKHTIMRIVLFLLVLLSSFNVSSQSLTADEVISKSIKYHDPEGKLFTKDVTMKFTGVRPGGEESKTSISFNIKKETFQMATKRDETSINSFYSKGKVSILVDGKKDYSEEVKKKYRLDKKRVLMMKNYYQYLWLMPLKLNDPGTIIDPEVKKIDFFGQELLQIKTSYSPKVGKDVWYFYFNPDTYALAGYRFYHDEAKNDGEYILLEGETQLDKIRIPKIRKWYTHKEAKFLGTDILEEIEIN